MNFCITNNLTKRLTNPQSSSYYATQHFQSPFLREKAVREIGSGSRYGITINGTISQFSCKLTVRSSLWDAKANKAAGKSFEAQRLNEKLENIKTNIGKQYQRLCDRDSYVTAEKVRNAFLGMGDACRLLLQTFDEYLAGFLKRVGKDRAYSSYDNYRKLPLSSNTNTV